LAVGSFFFSGFLALAYDAQAIRLLADLLLGFFCAAVPDTSRRYRGSLAVTFRWV
jgi:hypothetical protein